MTIHSIGLKLYHELRVFYSFKFQDIQVVKRLEFSYSFHPLGDNAIIIQLGNGILDEILEKIQILTSYLDHHPREWMIEYVPAYTTVAIFYDPLKIQIPLNSERLPYDMVCIQLQQLITELKITSSLKPRVIEIPVLYGGEYGPDLTFVANYNNISTDEVIQIHSSGNYIVHMIGFAPGFPYLGGMSEKIAAPRKETPLLKIPPRTVGIAGKQTGVYPIETPGGWQLIGRTPISLFRPYEESPSLLKTGDRIKFVSISLEEYMAQEEKYNDYRHKSWSAY